MAKKQYLDFEVHLNNADRVAELQANPPGETSLQAGKKYIIRAPDGAAVEFQDEENGDGTPLPFSTFIGMPPFTGSPLAGVPPPAGIRSYIYSAWFTATNPDWSKNFPTDVATFTRKSGGWFGIPALFGTTTRFYWRGIFVYDAPQTQDGTPGGSATTNISERIWLDPFPGNAAASPANPTAPEQEYSLTRDASAQVDGFGIGVRGNTSGNGIRQHNPTDFTGGGASADNLIWERLYVTWRKAGLTSVLFWRAYNSTAASRRVELALTPTGQILVTAYDGANNPTVIGTAGQFVLNKKTKLDLISRQAVNDGGGNPTGGSIQVFVNGVSVLTATFANGTGFQGIGFHARSEICTTDASGFTAEFDISFWMGARPTFGMVGLLKEPLLTGTDFVVGSRAVLVRASGDDASRAGWTGDWRTLGGLFPRTLNTGDAVTSVVALSRLAVTTDALRAVNALPGSQGMVAMIVSTHGWRGTNNGKVGYKLNGGADVLKVLGAPDATNNEGANNGARSWGHGMFSFHGVTTPAAITSLLLLREKGNDAVNSGTDHLSAVVEVIGTFHDCDYPPNLDPTLRNPLPELGQHNAPYPTTVWANNAAPPISPVIIKSGTYSGNATFQDLTFKAPVHWIWIQKITNTGTSPIQGRWFSTMLGAGMGGRKSPEPWIIPIQSLDPSFTAVATDNPPTGVGAVPDRSAQVAAIVAANSTMLPAEKGDLLGVIVRELNSANPGDGNNWGFLKKNDQGGVIPDDIIVWNPTLEHFDVLTDTGATWIADGVITNPNWVWTQVKDEGQQEQQTVVRIAGGNIEVNQVGDDYAYCAVSDPGQRFMLNGAMSHADSVLPIVHSLIAPNFTPLAAFYFDERPGTDGNLEMGYKGVGHAATEITKLNAAGSTIASALTFGAGSLTLNTGLGFGTDTHLVYNLWRINDSSGDPNIARVVQIGTYVGNGAGGNRDIAFPVPCGKRPLWAIVVPRAAKAWIRHHGHSGGNSSGIDGQHLATAIVGGGVDKITVSTTLNGNTVVYDFFVIVGGDTAGNDGWSGPGEFVPVDPTSPPGGGAYGPDPEDPTFPPDEPGGDTPGDPGGGDDDIDSDLSAECIPFTRRIFNDALSRIGISKRIANAATDTTEEANLCRQHYARAIEQTLRDFPWPFSTRYANLTLIAGAPATPANKDWTYSYERPSDCVFERRVVVPREGAVDPTPPPFQLSFSDSLHLGRIFTNEATAQLEYTARPLCTAGLGDPLFLDALTWRLASRIAGPLTRIADVIKICLEQYDAKIARAFEVLRPGNPGPRTTVDPTSLDIATGSAAANVAVVNRALIRIGAHTIANLGTEQSREAEAARVIFEEELKATIRDYPWAFCTEYTTPAWIAGTSSVPVNDDWQYSYRLPSNLVAMRRIVTGTVKRLFNPTPPMFRLAQDSLGAILFTDEIDPTIEYSQRLPDCVLRADTLFRDAFAWRLAACLAASLAQVDPSETEQLGRGPQDRPRERKGTEAQLRERATAAAWQQYYRAIAKARQADATEQQQDPNTGDAPWITGRD